MTSTTRPLHSDGMFSAQALRAMDSAPYGGAALSDVVSTMSRITATDAELWYSEWRATADRLAVEAEEYAVAGDVAASRAAGLRASTYYRTASVFLISPEVDVRSTESLQRQTMTFRSAVATLADPPDLVEVPYDGVTMPGYFFRVDDSGTPRPTMILTGGDDETAEELVLSRGFAALERGYHVLAVDGPGQGATLTDRGMAMRPDWENVITPVVDFALRHAEVDPDRLVLLGLNLGGYLAPRAATREHRLAACISDRGPYDVGQVMRQSVPRRLLSPRLSGVLATKLRRRSRKLTAGWELRRGMRVHGLTDPLAYMRIAERYSLRGLERLITCPTLVIAVEHDGFSAGQRELFEALICPKDFVLIPASEHSGRVDASTRRRHLERIFDWLDARIGVA